jgi:hypothetical protein
MFPLSFVGALGGYVSHRRSQTDLPSDNSFSFTPRSLSQLPLPPTNTPPTDTLSAEEDMANLNPTFSDLKNEDPEEYTETIELQGGSKPKTTRETHFRVTFRTGFRGKAKT